VGLIVATVPTLQEFPFPAVAAWMKEGAIVPFLGAGASRSGVDSADRLPSGQDLSAELIGRMGPAYVGQLDDRLAKVAQIFERSVFDRRALHEYLHQRLTERPNGAAFPSVARLLATLPETRRPLIIVTTNYDNEVERTFRDGGRPLFVVSQHLRSSDRGVTQVSVERPNGALRQEFANDFLHTDTAVYPAGSVFLYKMHGSAHWDLEDDHFDVIITEDDYADLLAQCGGATSTYVPPASLAVAFKRSRFLFLGYSLEDWTLRVLMRLLESRNALSSSGRLRHFAVQLGPTPIEEALWNQRNVTVYDGDLEEFCERLSAAMGGGG
jgi:hypothetical protein